MAINLPKDPSWATDGTYVSSTDPDTGLPGVWVGTPVRSAPPTLKQTQGYTPKADDAAEETNYVLGVHGDALNYHMNTLQGAGVHVQDHFLGQTLNPALWVAAGAGTCAPGDDSTSGATGALHLTATSGAGTTACKSGYPLSNIATDDFWISTRFRVVALPTTSQLNIGFFNSFGDGQTCCVRALGGTGFQLVYTLAGADTVVNLGIAIDTAYHTVLITRRAGIVNITFDGTEFTGVTMAAALSTPSMQAEIAAASSTASAWIDRMGFWISEG